MVNNTRIELKVERLSSNAVTPRKVLFERCIEQPSDIAVPYDSLLRSMQFIYGMDSIVTFSFSTY